MLSLLKIAGKYQHKIYLYFHLVCLLLEKNLKLSNKHQLDKLYNFRRANYQWNKGIFFVSIFISHMVFNQIRSEDPYMMQQRELFGLTEVSILHIKGRFAGMFIATDLLSNMVFLVFEHQNQ